MTNLRPSRSPYFEKNMPPTGRAKKPMKRTPNDASMPDAGLRLEKKILLKMIAEAVPKIVKSKFSSAVPIPPAQAARRRFFWSTGGRTESALAGGGAIVLAVIAHHSDRRSRCPCRCRQNSKP